MNPFHTKSPRSGQILQQQSNEGNEMVIKQYA